MRIHLNEEYAGFDRLINEEDCRKAVAIAEELREDKEDYTGWVKWLMISEQNATNSS